VEEICDMLNPSITDRGNNRADDMNRKMSEVLCLHLYLLPTAIYRTHMNMHNACTFISNVFHWMEPKPTVIYYNLEQMLQHFSLLIVTTLGQDIYGTPDDT
jgi:hypothetical protein